MSQMSDQTKDAIDQQLSQSCQLPCGSGNGWQRPVGRDQCFRLPPCRHQGNVNR